MKIVKLFQYIIAALLAFSFTQTLACKKKPAETVESKNASMKHKLIPGARFDKRGLDLRKRRKIGFPARFKGVKKGQVVIEKRDGLHAKTESKTVNIEKAQASSNNKMLKSPDKTTKQAEKSPASPVKPAAPVADSKK